MILLLVPFSSAGFPSSHQGYFLALLPWMWADICCFQFLIKQRIIKPAAGRKKKEKKVFSSRESLHQMFSCHYMKSCDFRCTQCLLWVGKACVKTTAHTSIECSPVRNKPLKCFTLQLWHWMVLWEQSGDLARQGAHVRTQTTSPCFKTPGSFKWTWWETFLPFYQ